MILESVSRLRISSLKKNENGNNKNSYIIFFFLKKKLLSASFLGIRPPIPYKWRKWVKRSYLRYGMNFAYGGTGVFDTLVNEPNMTTQIDFFQRLVEEKVYSKQDLNSSIGLVSVAGNDYAAYLARNANDLQVSLVN